MLVVGVGGLGCPAASALAAGGVGTLVIADPDRVELSNLPRQLLHDAGELGELKVESAARALADRHPEVAVETIAEAVAEPNVADLLRDVDVVVDATDGTATKLAINDAAVRAGVALCHAGVVGFCGQLLTVVPGQVPCVRCVFSRPRGRDRARGSDLP